MIEFGKDNDDTAVSRSAIPPACLKRKRSEIYALASSQSSSLLKAQEAEGRVSGSESTMVLRIEQASIDAS